MLDINTIKQGRIRDKCNIIQNKVGESKLRNESNSEQTREVITPNLFVNNIKSSYL